MGPRLRAVHVKFNAKRADFVAAITSHEYTLKVGKQPRIARWAAEKYTDPRGARFSPEPTFKDGTATQGALHMDDIEGTPLIKGVVWTATALEKHFGLFEGDLFGRGRKLCAEGMPKIFSNAQPAKVGTRRVE